MRRLRALAVALAASAACPPAWADRSRLADEADVVEPGDCQLELGAERRRPRGEAPERESSIEFGCGIGWRSELTLALARLHGGTGGRERKLGVSGRTAVVDRKRDDTGWTLVYGFERLRMPDAAWRTRETFVAIEASRQFGAAWLVEARLGTVRERIERRSAALWAIGLEHLLAGEALVLRAAVGRDGPARPLAEIGLRAEVWGEDVALSVSAGSGGGPPRERRLALALSIDF